MSEPKNERVDAAYWIEEATLEELSERFLNVPVTRDGEQVGTVESVTFDREDGIVTELNVSDSLDTR